MSNKWATTGRGHDLFPGHGTNGKGDKNRTSNDEQYRKNYDEIDWGTKKNSGRDSDSESERLCRALVEHALGGTNTTAEKPSRSSLPAVSANQDGDSAVCESGFGSPRKTSV